MILVGVIVDLGKFGEEEPSKFGKTGNKMTNREFV